MYQVLQICILTRKYGGGGTLGRGLNKRLFINIEPEHEEYKVFLKNMNN